MNSFRPNVLKKGSVYSSFFYYTISYCRVETRPINSAHRSLELKNKFSPLSFLFNKKSTFRCFFWSGRRGSNSRQPAWKAGTLPLSYFRILLNFQLVWLSGRVLFFQIRSTSFRLGTELLPHIIKFSIGLAQW